MAANTAEILARAFGSYKAGRMRDAEVGFRQVLAEQPRNDRALCGLAAVAYTAGRPDHAADLLGRAIAQRGDVADYHYNLGRALMKIQRPAEALAALQRATELRPDYAQAHNELGIALASGGRLDEAIERFRRATELQPDYAEAHNNLGVAFTHRGRVGEALACCRRAVQLDANYGEAHSNLCIALKDAGEYDAAVAAGRRAVELRPKLAPAWSNLGTALRYVGRIEEAADVFARAVALRPQAGQLHVNLSVALQELGRLDEAAEACRTAIRVERDMPMAHWNLSLILLQQGEYAQGWAEHEWRWAAHADHMAIRPFAQPRWEGEALDGRTLLLYAEQGFGDAIQFARYVPIVAKMGARIVLECQPEQRRLFESLEGVERIVAQRQPLGQFDVQCPLMSVARLLGTTLDTIPADVPYLRADADVSRRWRGRVDGLGAGLKVGLVWAGKPIPDRNRTAGLAALAELGRVAGVEFVSLQQGPGAEDAAHPPERMKLADWGGELTDFAQTAALIECLDVVITIDTAVAHLAGAMGKATWVMLPVAADWRWLRQGAATPWYPTTRLFRQRTWGDWSAPAAEAAAALEAEARPGGRA